MWFFFIPSGVAMAIGLVAMLNDYSHGNGEVKRGR